MSRLLELRLHRLALIRDARLDCDEGFGVLTGETGSGKSLCIAGLRFVLGGRVDGELVSEGSSVSAVFEAEPESIALLARLGVPTDELITLTREMSGGGRTSCRVNGGLVSQAVLRELGELLAEITSQGASHRLLRRNWQRRVLDCFGGEAIGEARSAMAAAHTAWRAAEAAQITAWAAGRRTAAELDAATQLIAELEPLDLRDGEEEELAVERLRLRHAVAIAAAAASLAQAIAGRDGEGGAAEQVERAAIAIEGLGGIDSTLAELGVDAARAAETLRELGLAARRHVDRVEFDAARLERVEERLDRLARVRRRHGSVAAAMTALDAAQRLREAAAGAADSARLEAAAAAAQAGAVAAARQLTAARQAAARRLERAVGPRLAALELPQARFRIVLDATPDAAGLDLGDARVRCDGDGADAIEFRLAANKGGIPLPLDSGPSGGELSRLALALASLTGGASEPLLALDEVDAGIGGETAARVGDLLAEIGAGRQVLAVTHRPEIAARAGWHLLVSKQEVGGGPETSVSRVTGAERVGEIARLMSGRATEAALVRAGELLQEGTEGRRGRRRAAG